MTRKLSLSTLEVKSFKTGLDDYKGGYSCPYVCIGDPNFTMDPNGCLSEPQIICDDPLGYTNPQNGC